MGFHVEHKIHKSEHNGEQMRTREVLRRLMTANGIKITDLSQKTRVAMGTLNKILENENVQSRDSTLQPIAKYFKISLAQLRGYEPIEGISDGTDSIQPTGYPFLEANQILPWLAGNLPIETLNNWILADGNFDAKTFVAEVTDEGVAPFASIGDELIVDPDATGNSNGLCMIMRGGDIAFRYRVKRLGEVFYKSDHPSLREMTEDECDFIGYVAARTQKSLEPTYEGDKVARSKNHPAPNQDLIQMDLMRECVIYVEAALEGQTISASDRSEILNNLYKHCIDKGYSAEMLKNGEVKDINELV